MKRVMLSILLTAAMLMSVCSINALWDGVAAEGFSAGDGSASAPFLIEDEAQLAYFCAQLNAGNSFANQYVDLGCDLDMTAVNLNSYGTFSGSFDGNGHTVTLNEALFAVISGTGEVKRLTCISRETASSALLCGSNYGAIESCRVSGSVDSDWRAGLLCRENDGTIKNSCAVGAVKGYGDDCDCYVGMVAWNTGIIENCYSVLTLTGGASGRYNSLYKHPIAAYGNSRDELLHCYAHISGVNVGVVGDADMKSAEFAAMLNMNNTAANAVWEADSDNVNGGFPVLKNALSVQTGLSYTSDRLFAYSGDCLTTAVSCTEPDCAVYYTTDGSDPRTSQTRIKYTSDITLRGDFAVRSVALKNGEYGVPRRQEGISVRGGGTANSPYLISTKSQLYAVRMDTAAHYLLENDLSFSASDFNNGSVFDGGWSAIKSFSGVFDGNGHTISGLFGNDGGLFANNSGTIRNLLLKAHLLNREKGNFGAIADNNSGVITRCYAASAFTAETVPYNNGYIGGIVGCNNSGGSVTLCSSGGIVGARENDKYNWIYVGGIAGYGDVSRCVNKARVVALSSAITEYVYAGGITSLSGYAYDCRNDGSFYVNVRLDYEKYISAGAAAPYSQSSIRCYDAASAGFISGTVTDCYKAREQSADDRLLEGSFGKLDFKKTWMITADGPTLQGVMDENGCCLVSEGYTAPTCCESGRADYRCALCGKTSSESLTLSEKPSMSVSSASPYKITLSPAKALGGTVTAALYDDTGRLLALKAYPAAAELTTDLEKPPEGQLMKIMWWCSTDSARPLCTEHICR